MTPIVFLPLTRGFVTVIDFADMEKVGRVKWYASNQGSSFYAVRSVARRQVYLHRALLDAPAGMDVDHRDRNTLDNRRENLRLATRQENLRNARKRTGTSSKFKGVTWDAENCKWQAQLSLGGKHIRLGRFQSEIAAAQAYDAAAKKYFDNFARTNDIPA